MSVNWVMLDASKGFVQLPNETRIWSSPPRTALSIATPRSYPGNNPISLQSPTGTVHLTNQRIVYLPADPTQSLQSLSAPLLNLHDTHVTAPFFGPNVWYAVLQPVPGGGLIPNESNSSTHIEIKLTFKDGGAYDFQTNLERLKERLREAVETARERNLMSNASGGGNGNGTTTGGSLDYSNVHLDELPAYEETNTGNTNTTATNTTSSDLPAPHASRPITGPGGLALPPIFNNNNTTGSTSTSSSSQQQYQQQQQQPSQQMPPDEPPPGYEETQQRSVAEELERRLGGK